MPAVVADCQRQGAELTLAPSKGDGAAPALPDADLDPSVELPFAVESGTAVALGGRFFVSALRHEPHGGVALLGRVDARTAASAAAAPTANTVLELAKLDGEVPPARLATDGEDLIVALETPRPSGFQIRVARLVRADLERQLVWQNGPQLSRGESNTFDVAGADGRALIAWDDWPPQSKLGRIFVSVLEAGADAENVAPRAVSPADADAEEPRVVARPGGYWIAWLVNARAGENPTRVYDPGESETEEPHAPAAVTPSGRWVELLALDALGQPVGHVRRLTGGKERVVGYDLASSTGGDAWVAWRQDASSAGAAGGRILFAEVRSEGAPKIVAVREGDVGSGEPIWLAIPPPSVSAAAAPGMALASPWLTSPWLTFPDQRDRTVLLPIALGASAPDRPGTPLALGAELEGATALASIDGQLLFAQPQGRAVRLISAHCNPIAAAAGAGADASAPPQP